MKIQDLGVGAITLVDLVYPVGHSATIRPGRMASVVWSEEADSFLVTQEDQVALTSGRTTNDEDALLHLCRTNLPRLVWVPSIQTAEPEGCTLKVHTFPTSLAVPELNIGIDDKIVEAAKRLAPSRVAGSPKKVQGWLADQCVLSGASQGNGPAFAFATIGTDTEDDLPGAFVLHGRTTRVHVRLVPHPSGVGHIHRVERVARSRATSQRPVHLLEASVQFVDITQAGLVRADWRAEWDRLSDTESFLKTWNRYGELEIEDTLRLMAEIGGIDVHGWERTVDGVRFDVVDGAPAERLARLRRDRILQAGMDLDIWPAPPTHLSLLTQDANGPEPPSILDRLGRERAHFTGTVRAITDGSLVLEGIEGDPPSHGTLALSVARSRVVFKRRDTAQGKIREGTAGMPQLGFLLEGKATPRPRRNRIQPMSASLEKKLFADHPPTASQIEAIDVALNTPDIALIQGPPGTGKTTVIRAILERLNELSSGQRHMAGQFLLTGYQHDAVENAAGRIDINGLPPIKFGQRSGVDDEVLEETEHRIDAWRTSRAATVRDAEEGLELTEAQRSLHTLIEGYLLAPGPPRHAAHVLEDAARAAAGLIPSELADRLRDRADDLGGRRDPFGHHDEARVRLLRAARALRAAPGPFSDDGAPNAARFLALAQQVASPIDLDPPTRDVLETLQRGAPGASDAFWSLADATRQRLIQQATPRSTALEQQPVLLDDVVALLGEVRDALEAQRRASLDGASLAVAEYLDALENAPSEVRAAIIDYTTVFAATCQQSARFELAQAKAAEEGVYDTVIVDEAARANPLDLFVPLVQAQRRIILVGDHRQLPHIIEDRLADQLDGEAAAQAEDLAAPAVTVSEEIRRSLFEHLFQDALRRHHENGDPRRAVTLDAQFRMHPLLGDFISKQFYEVHGEPRIDSPLPEERFSHRVPGFESLAAVWLSVPEGKEARETKGVSWTRPTEAEVVATIVEHLVEADEAAHLNVGVISFYRGQVAEIEKALHARGLMDQSAQGDYSVAARFRDHLDAQGRPSGEARLRVGTVDAFQGREFDIVLLSVVRSNNLPDDDEVARRRKYGHLMSPNRLNVAMSRQKRLLVVVGDHALVDAPHAPVAIGPLVAFAALAHDSPLGRVGTYGDFF